MKGCLIKMLFNLEGLAGDFLLPKQMYIVPFSKCIFRNDGTLENLDVDKDGNAAKVYSDLINNELSAGIQPSKVKHEDYKALGIVNLGSLYPPKFK